MIIAPKQPFKKQTMQRVKLDRIDRRILAALAKDARLSLAALSEKVGLSKTPVAARLKRLETEGFILGYHAALDVERLGLAQVAFALDLCADLLVCLVVCFFAGL